MTMKYTANLRTIFYSANSKAKKHGNKWGIIIGSVVNNARALNYRANRMQLSLLKLLRCSR